MATIRNLALDRTGTFDLKKEELEFAQKSRITEKMIPKKIHEVILMARFVNQVCEEQKMDNVVDIGAGEGYISHLLAQLYKKRVIAVEGNQKIIDAGVARMKKIDYWLKYREEKAQGLHSTKHEQKTEDLLPTKVEDDPLELDLDSLQIETTTKKQKEHKIVNFVPLQDKISQTKQSVDFLHFIFSPKNVDEFQSKINFGKPFAMIGYFLAIFVVILISLHTCGNFALMVMDLFLKAKDCKSLIGLGCCYHCLIDSTFLLFVNIFRRWKIWTSSRWKN